jgi:hypothetical protein
MGTRYATGYTTVSTAADAAGTTGESSSLTGASA